MAEFKIPVQIDGFKCVEEMAQAVLNYTYKGKTLQEWADSISKPKTNADKIRSMTDEELADNIAEIQLNTLKIYNDDNMPVAEELREYLLYWLKKEVK